MLKSVLVCEVGFTEVKVSLTRECRTIFCVKFSALLSPGPMRVQ